MIKGIELVGICSAILQTAANSREDNAARQFNRDATTGTHT